MDGHPALSAFHFVNLRPWVGVDHTADPVIFHEVSPGIGVPRYEFDPHFILRKCDGRGRFGDLGALRSHLDSVDTRFELKGFETREPHPRVVSTDPAGFRPIDVLR